MPKFWCYGRKKLVDWQKNTIIKNWGRLKGGQAKWHLNSKHAPDYDSLVSIPNGVLSIHGVV